MSVTSNSILTTHSTSQSVVAAAVNNPMQRHPTATATASSNASDTNSNSNGYNKVETLYDKLNHLSEEIAEGIVNLKGGKRQLLQRELDDLRDASYRERSPEAVYNILLFRKYAGIANVFKDAVVKGDSVAAVGNSNNNNSSNSSNSSSSAERMSLIGELPQFVHHPEDESLLKGTSAFTSVVFRLRCIAAALAIIVFSVMSAAPFINEADFSPSQHINSSSSNGSSNSCKVEHIDGSFNFRAYQFVIAVGVLCLLQQSTFLYYYWLPVSDQSGNKYIPGLSTALATICSCCHCCGSRDNNNSSNNNSSSSESIAAAVSQQLTRYAKYVECCGDALLLLLALLSFAIALLLLQLPVQFTIDKKETEYYTLSTSFLTLYNWHCLSERSNPTAFIRGSLATLFFLLLLLLVLFLISFRGLRQKLGPDFSFRKFFPTSAATAAANNDDVEENNNNNNSNNNNNNIRSNKNKTLKIPIKRTSGSSGSGIGSSAMRLPLASDEEDVIEVRL